MKQKLSICYAAKIEIIENRRTSLQASSICSKLLCNAIFRLLSGRHGWHLLRLLIHPPLLLLVTYFSRVDLLHQYYPWPWTRGTGNSISLFQVQSHGSLQWSCTCSLPDPPNHPSPSPRSPRTLPSLFLINPRVRCTHFVGRLWWTLLLLNSLKLWTVAKAGRKWRNDSEEKHLWRHMSNDTAVLSIIHHSSQAFAWLCK